MNFCVLHTAMDNIGGAEMVGLTLARELKADIVSTNVDTAKIRKMGFEDITLKSIGKIPVNAPYRQQFALKKFAKVKLNGSYDFYLIDGDWAVSSAVHNRPNLWYVHSPMREIWDLYEDTRKHTVQWYHRWAFDAWVQWNRYLNHKYLKHIDILVCNSANTQSRIKKYLKRDARVIYPPVDTDKYIYRKNGDFWLSVNRLISHKRIDLQVEAFRRLPHEKLIIVGSFEQSRHFKRYAKRMESIKPSNVEILSWVDQSRLCELYADCKGFITTAKDEDFGMSAVEAMAAGKPVIAPREGGYQESVIDGQTGILIDDINETKLIAAIKTLGTDPQKYKEACQAQAKQFDTFLFIAKIREEITKYTEG